MLPFKKFSPVQLVQLVFAISHCSQELSHAAQVITSVAMSIVSYSPYGHLQMIELSACVVRDRPLSQ